MPAAGPSPGSIPIMIPVKLPASRAAILCHWKTKAIACITISVIFIPLPENARKQRNAHNLLKDEEYTDRHNEGDDYILQ